MVVLKESFKIGLVVGWGMLYARSVSVLVQVFQVASKVEVLYFKQNQNRLGSSSSCAEEGSDLILI